MIISEINGRKVARVLINDQLLPPAPAGPLEAEARLLAYFAAKGCQELLRELAKQTDDDPARFRALVRSGALTISIDEDRDGAPGRVRVMLSIPQPARSGTA